jgi:hypothetical protein
MGARALNKARLDTSFTTRADLDRGECYPSKNP